MERLRVHIGPFSEKIDHHSRILLLGSCFSQEIHDRFKYHGFNSSSNPFGTVFHPEPLARFILETLSGRVEERMHLREDVHLSWDASALVYGMTENELRERLSAIRNEWREKLVKADFLFVTFGTAWGYKHKENGLIVANCHRLPQSGFDKEFSRIDQIVWIWQEVVKALKQINPTIQIIFTVSPVRHYRDGLIENNRSKAVLHLAIEELRKLTNSYYFPSYEIIVDELRDYRYFTEDLVHPNSLAVNYLWDRFTDVIMNDETKKISAKVASLRRQSEHRFIHPESEESYHFRLKTSSDIDQLLHDHPEIVW